MINATRTTERFLNAFLDDLRTLKSYTGDRIEVEGDCQEEFDV
jgi:hypothetical protein